MQRFVQPSSVLGKSENCLQVLLSNLEYIGEVLGVVAAKTE